MKSAFYGLLPRIIRHNKNLKPNSKVLYSEITATLDEDGVCTKTNSYFQNVLGIGKSAISNCLTELREQGFIGVVIEMKENSQRFIKRYITPTPSSYMGRVKVNNEITHTTDLGGVESVAPLLNGKDYDRLEQTLLYNNNIITKVYTKPNKRHTPINKNMNDEQKNALLKIVNEFYNTQQFRHPRMIESKWSDNLDIINGSLNVLYDLITIDKYDYESIRDVMKWAVDDKFWGSNILSLKLLRSKASNGFTKFQNLYHKYNSK